MSLNDSHSLERTLDYCDKNNDSFLNTTDHGSSIHPCSIPNVSISTVGNCPSNSKAINSQQQQQQHIKKSHIHFNRLWSVWYGVLVTILQGYLIVQGLHKYLGCTLLTWKNGLPVTELNMQLIFCGLTILFLPLFFASALFKVGNLANDGVKLTSRKGTCSSEPPIFEDEGNSSTLKSLWIHGCPISVFIHIITALCLLLPHLLLEAKLIQGGHLPKDNIWKSEIDFVMKHNDRLVILSFINTAPYQNDSNLHGNRFDDGIESLDYDLDPFETHESLQSAHPPSANLNFNVPTTYYGSPSLTSIQISTFSDFEEDWPPTTIPTKIPKPSTTLKMTTTTERPITSTTQRLTTTTERTTTTTTTTMTTPAPTTTTTTTTTTTMRTPAPTIPTPFIWTNSPIVTERVHHSSNRNKQNHKNRKHNHKKHHKKQPEHHQDSFQEFDEVDDNLELKFDRELDFDIFDREVHMVDSNKNSKKKHKQQNGSGTRSSTESLERSKPTSKFAEQIERPKTTFRPNEQIERPKATQKVKTKDKDSDIHLLKPEKVPDYAVPSTTVTTNSKIIEIKPKNNPINDSLGIRKIIKRYIEDESTDMLQDQDILFLEDEVPSVDEDIFILREQKGELYPAALVGSVPNFTKTTVLEGIAGILQSFFDENTKFDPKVWFQQSPSLEFLNLALALLVWSVRYPSVFWDTSKAFTIVFSLQMIANSIDILMLHVGTSILFKLQIVGQFMTVQNQQSPLLLNGIVTLALTLLAYILMISSAMILYLYGHSRLSAKIRDCHMITMKDGDIWSYFSHCASLCFILALSVVKAPIIHDLSVTYQISLDRTVFIATMTSITHILLWIVVWLALTAKRQWSFKLPVIESIYQTRNEAIQPLLTQNGRQINFSGPKTQEEETIYWPSSPKLKVTFNDVPSTLSEHNLVEHDGKRHLLSTIRSATTAGEIDEGDYATLKHTQMQISEYDEVINLQRMQRQNDDVCGYDDTSEEGKLLECVQDESITYASTKDLEPPHTTATVYLQERYMTSPMMSPLAPVTVTVHSSEVHVSTSTPRFLRRADSGMPSTNEALTPKSDSNSDTNSTTSPPERALSESSSGVHSGEENKDEVVIRPRPAGVPKSIIKPPAVIEEEPYGRITNMKMSSFKDGVNQNNCNTLPSNRGCSLEQPPIDYSQCNTMPLMPGAHQINRMSANDSSPKQRTTLPNNIRYSSAGHYLRQIPQLQNAESPYGVPGRGSGHHTFSKLIQNEVLPPPPPNSMPPNHHMMPSSQSQQQFMANHQQIHNFNTTSSSFTSIQTSPRYDAMCNNNPHQYPAPPPHLQMQH